ncbi:3-keto-5-aminohexanoate cleavage protein [Dehalococcoidia bacterium]|nr:3-keto-5-aminohexanoate cleavage protein [Dehalococcoidia bacterium]
MAKMMISAAINEASTKEQNPHVPYGVDEIVEDSIACVDAGASIIHFHARDSQTGDQIWEGYDDYVKVMEAIRKERDVILYPSFPPNRPKEERFAHVIALADNPSVGLELVAFGIGSTNMGTYDPDKNELRTHTHVNPHEDVIYFIESMTSRGIKPALGIRDVGHMRHLAMYRDMGLIEDPATIDITITDGDTFGPYPNARGIMMYLDMIPPGMDLNWFVASYGARGTGASFRRMSMLASAMGGHVRVGLGDNPNLDGQTYTNAEQVRITADMARQAGREVAKTADARQLLGLAI